MRNMFLRARYLSIFSFIAIELKLDGQCVLSRTVELVHLICFSGSIIGQTGGYLVIIKEIILASSS